MNLKLFLYDTGLILYSFLLRIAALFHPKARSFIKGRKGLMKQISGQLAAETRPRIWMHCASLGEFEQGRPLIEAIRRRHPQSCLVLTFFSPSGYEACKHYEGADYICYLPLDNQRNAEKFIEILNPALAFFVKYEFWYHYLNTLYKKQIPAFLISAIFQSRQPFFKWYGALHRKMLTFFTHIFVQDQRSEQLLLALGIPDVAITGDTRFDRAAAVLATPRLFPSLDIFKNGEQLIIAGSTWQEDERLLYETMQLLPAGYKLLVAPHEIHEKRIQEIQSRFGEDCCLWDAAPAILREKRVGIVTSMGQLAYLYRYAAVVWMGGGFTRSGIHNIIEPAVYGHPVFFGPNYTRYREAIDMIALSAAISVPDAQTFARLLQRQSLLQELAGNAKAYIQGQLGATHRIIHYLELKNLFNIDKKS